MKKQRFGRVHAIIPDCQVKPNVSTDHLTWVGNYIADKQPDVIVQIGDFADMPSLNYHGKAAEMEGQRYDRDIKAAKDAMNKLLAPIRKVKGYKPRLVLTMGNHEYRIDRFAKENPKMIGTVSLKDLGYTQAGWEVVPFLRPIAIDGFEYCHYFVSGSMGRPVSSAAALLRARHSSAVMGHVQHTDIAIHPRSGHMAIFCGICYTHDENYLTPQGNSTRRQIVFLHEVHNGIADPMLVSLRFLKARYS
jgi:hypothetical protein